MYKRRIQKKYIKNGYAAAISDNVAPVMLHRLMLTASLTTVLPSPQNFVWCWIPVLNFVVYL